MEWLLLAAVILAFPVIAIVALVKASNNARELLRVEQALGRTQRELAALTTKFDQLGATGVAPAPTATPEPVKASAPVAAAEPPKPSVAAAPVTPPPSVPHVAPTAKAPPPPRPPTARGLEENLTSRLFIWLGAVAVALAGTFLVKYSIDEGYLGPAARCILGFLLGTALAVGGEWLRRRPLH